MKKNNKLRTHWAYLVRSGSMAILLFGLFAMEGQAQIAYTEDFNGCNAPSCNGWALSGDATSQSITATTGNDYTPCADASAKGNIWVQSTWQGDTYNTPLYLTSTSTLGLSNGELATLMFDNKMYDYDGTVATAGSGSFTAEWGTSSSGPWTTISSFDNVSSTSCASSGALTFTPPNGSSIFIRITADIYGTDPDVWAVIDNISLGQPAGCNNPTATAGSLDPDCQAGTFSLDLTLTGLGDAVTVTIQESVNAGAYTNVAGATGVSALTTYSMNDYTMDTETVNFRVIDAGVPSCLQQVGGTFGFASASCPISTFPYCQDFDLFSTCGTGSNCTTTCALGGGWSNEGGAPDWITNDDGTPSGASGPDDDQNGGGNYLYIETSALCGPRVAYSPSFDLSTMSGAEFSMYYHMYGDDIGTLSIDVEDVLNNPGTFTNVFTISGEQQTSNGDAWAHTGWLNLNAYAGSWVRMRITGTNSATFFGDIAFDEFCLQEIVACSVAPTPGNTVGPSTTCSGNQINLTIQNISIEGGISYQWQDSPDGSTWTDVGGATADTYSPSPAMETWYRCNVTCSGNGTTPSTPLQVVMTAPFICNICFPTYSNNTEPICSVSFGSMDNTSCGTLNCDAAYRDYTGSVPAPNVIQGFSYDLTVTGNTDGGFSNYFTAFFDWDQDGTFEDAQQIGSINADACGTDVTLSVLIPATSTGPTLMRIIKDYSNSVAYPSDACGAYDYGQTEDYFINVVDCSPPSATVTENIDCALGIFTVEVVLTGLGDASDVDITEDVNGGGVTVTHDDETILTSYTMGPYALGDDVLVGLVHNQEIACSIDLGNFAPEEDAGETCHAASIFPTIDQSCFDVPVCASSLGVALGTDVVVESVELVVAHSWNADLEIQLINPNGTSVDLILDRFGNGDDLGVIAGCSTPFVLQDGGAPLSNTNTSAVVGSWAPEQPLTNFNDGSDPNGIWTLRVCDDADDDSGSLRWVKVNLACIPIEATVTPAPDCGNNQFYLDVNITNTGGGQVDIYSDLNGLETSTSSTGTVQIGPYAHGATVDIDLAHHYDGACDLALGNTTFYCPPANDDCGNAEAINCNSITSGTTLGSLDDSEAIACTSSYDGDQGVWYTVAGWEGEMTASTCTGSDFDTKLHVYTGTCGGGFVCVAGGDDECATQSSVTWAGASGTTYHILVHGNGGAEGNFDLLMTCGDEIIPCDGGENTLALELSTDANFGETTYSIEAIGIPGVELCGGGFGSEATFNETCCLPDGCYQLRVMDSGNNGIVGGGYILRDGNGERIIDNAGNFLTGGLSAMSNSALDDRHFCLPLGTDKMIASHCDKENFNETDFLIASANPAVLAEFGGPNASTSGYQWKIFNPNGGYIRHLARTHTNLAAGVAPGPSAVQSIRPSNWWTLPVPGDELMNVRIRTRVAGVWSAYGPACRHMWVSTPPPTCPTTQLVDNVNNNNHSCDVTRTFGGSDKLVAWSVPGAGAYRFTFKVVGEPTTFVRYSLTNTRQLYWSNNTMPLNAPYEVSVAVRMGGPGDPWCDEGPSCPVFILSAPVVQNREATANTGLALWPNPNSGSVLNLRLDEVPAGVDEVVVEIYDAFGKRVHGEAIADPGSSINTVLGLNGNLANGIYMVNVIVGNEVMTQRLVVQ